MDFKGSETQTHYKVIVLIKAYRKTGTQDPKKTGKPGPQRDPRKPGKPGPWRDPSKTLEKPENRDLGPQWDPTKTGK